MSSKIESREFKVTHLWKILNYSRIVSELEEKLRSEKFSAAGDDLNWRLEHTLHIKNVSEMYVSFNLRPDCYDDLRKCESVSGSVDVYLMNDNKKTYCNISNIGNITDSFTFSYDEQNRNCKVTECTIYRIKENLCEDALNILCKITYCKKNETVTISSSNNSNAVRISECRLSSDMERCFIGDDFEDMTISVKGKQYQAHKTILAARSTVFDKMLRTKMSESEKNHIDITDMDQEIFEEMLHYIYTGKVKNLVESAFELLPAADKYDLGELGSMCEEVLIKKISTDNAASILILADTHRAEELKARTLRFIKQNYASCKEFTDTKVWNILTAHNFQLMKDMMAAFCKKQKHT